MVVIKYAITQISEARLVLWLLHEIPPMLLSRCPNLPLLESASPKTPSFTAETNTIELHVCLPPRAFLIRILVLETILVTPRCGQEFWPQICPLSALQLLPTANVTCWPKRQLQMVTVGKHELNSRFCDSTSPAAFFSYHNLCLSIRARLQFMQCAQQTSISATFC